MNSFFMLVNKACLQTTLPERAPCTSAHGPRRCSGGSSCAWAIFAPYGILGSARRARSLRLRVQSGAWYRSLQWQQREILMCMQWLPCCQCQHLHQQLLCHQCQWWLLHQNILLQLLRPRMLPHQLMFPRQLMLPQLPHWRMHPRQLMLL